MLIKLESCSSELKTGSINLLLRFLLILGLQKSQCQSSSETPIQNPTLLPAVRAKVLRGGRSQETGEVVLVNRYPSAQQTLNSYFKAVSINGGT